MVKALKRTVFVGEFRHAVDEKNRLAIPAKWRAAASGTQEFYVLPLPGSHLYVLSESAMEKMMEKADDISIGDERRNALRIIAGGGHATPVDKQGRILLTEKLRKHAGIQSEAVLVGVLKGFDIWSPAQHEKINKSSTAEFARSAKALGI